MLTCGAGVAFAGHLAPGACRAVDSDDRVERHPTGHARRFEDRGVGAAAEEQQQAIAWPHRAGTLATCVPLCADTDA